MPEVLHLQPGSTVDLAHLRHRVTLADDMTLGALCESLERMAPDQQAALEAILGDPVAPWLDDGRRVKPGRPSPRLPCETAMRDSHRPVSVPHEWASLATSWGACLVEEQVPAGSEPPSGHGRSSSPRRRYQMLR